MIFAMKEGKPSPGGSLPNSLSERQCHGRVGSVLASGETDATKKHPGPNAEQRVENRERDQQMREDAGLYCINPDRRMWSPESRHRGHRAFCPPGPERHPVPLVSSCHRRSSDERSTM